MSYHETHLIWIDLEMTGLSVDHDHIIEIATIVTDSHLNIVAEGPALAIYQPEEILNQMDAWNTTHHHNSGLVTRIKNSLISESEAEQQTLAFLEQHVAPGLSPMCGNSICQDRRFLVKHMPNLAKYFHYRNLDVTSLKILAQRWAPQLAKKTIKESHHLAMEDVRDSIAELRYYRDNFLKCEISPS